MTIQERVRELGLQGFGCSQILMTIALEARGTSNPDLVRAVSGLHGGVGYSGRLCGALTGGACVLALYAGKGTPTEHADVRLAPMVASLVDWFDEEYTARYGGTDCNTIVGGDPASHTGRCARIIEAVQTRIEETLRVNDLALAQPPRAR